MPNALPEASDSGDVNPHYLDNVVRSSEQREVEAAEDIVASNGMKLLAKGTRIAPETRERLLKHKLSQPLEQVLRVRNGVAADGLGPQAERLLERYPLLQTLRAPARTQSLPITLSSLPLSSAVQTLLTVYADAQGDRLTHSVGVAMLTLGLAHRLLPPDSKLFQQLALAGLLHDVGELYIDSAHLHANGPLQADQWRHIVAHPVVGWRVLKPMQGAGPLMAELVLNHHERIDGFGYPRGLQGEALPLMHQLLAAAEWLMALIDSGEGALARASVASRLIPGEFNPVIVDLLNTATRLERPQREPEAPALEAALPVVERVAGALLRFRGMREWIETEIERAGPGLRAALQLSLTRLLRIKASFSSTGLDIHDPGTTLHELAAQSDAHLQQELHLLINEFSWRLRQLEREALQRASLLPPAELALVQQLIAKLRGESAQGAAQPV